MEKISGLLFHIFWKAPKGNNDSHNLPPNLHFKIKFTIEHNLKNYRAAIQTPWWRFNAFIIKKSKI